MRNDRKPAGRLPARSRLRHSTSTLTLGRALGAALLAATALAAAGDSTLAQDATWLAAPGSANFNAGANWSTSTLPTGTAFFGASNRTSLFFASDAQIGGWTFNAGAANYSFSNSRVLEFTGAGIVINGGGATIANSGDLYFRNASSAGGASITNSSFTEFRGTSTAGSATITNTETLLFYDNSTAGSATISNNSGLINFHTDSTAGNASITNNASLGFYDDSKAGSATITNRNSLTFYDSSSADGATIVNESSLIFRGFSTAATATITTAAGATTQFIAAGSSAGARFITQSGGVVDISDPTGHATMTAGSIEGAGNYLIGAKQFTVGSNDLSTEVSGVISGAGGALVKTGTGTLTLTGTNTYTGGTTISAGALQIGNGGTTGSITGNIANNAQLIFNRSDAVSFNGMIYGSGSLRKLGTGTLTLTGENSYSGGTTIAGGAISIEKEGKLGNVSGALTLDGGVLQVTGTALAGLTRDIVFGANGGGFDIVEAGHSFTVTQSFSGPGSLSKAGAGTLVLSGTHDYSGATSVLGGRLVSDTAAGLSPNSDYTIAAGAVLEAAGGGGLYGVGSLAGAGEVVIGTGSVLVTGSTNATTTFSGSFSGGGSLEYNGTGTQIYTGTGSLGGGLSVCSCGAGGGSFVIRGGSLTLGDFVMVSSGTLIVDQGGRLDAGGNGLLVASALRIDGAGTRVTVGDTFVQGFFDPATVSISAGATLTSRASGVGPGPGAGVYGLGATASVLVTGTGSRWSVDGGLEIGRSGETFAASVTVADGGTLVQTSGDIVIAEFGTLNLGAGGKAGTVQPASSAMRAALSPISRTPRRWPR